MPINSVLKNIDDDKLLKKKEVDIHQSIWNNTNTDFNIRDFVNCPSYVGSWVFDDTGKISLLAGIVYANSLDSPSKKIILLHDSGFGVMKKLGSYLFSSIVSAHESPDTITFANKGHLLNSQDDVIGKYDLHFYNKKEHSFIIPLLEQTYFNAVNNSKLS
jgi:hypothetical protein